APSSPVLWDGRPWTLINAGETRATLLPDVGPPVQLPTPFFLQLVDTGRITAPPALDDASSASTSAEVQRQLAAASPRALAEAHRRFHLVQAYLPRHHARCQGPPRRTLARWAARFRTAQAQGG